MTSSSRLHFIRVLACGVVLILPAISSAQQLPPLAKQVAKTYGLDSFGKVEAIRYTFAIPGQVPPHTWEWNPKTDTVTYEGKDKQGNPVKVTYKRSELDSQSDAVKTQIDPGFVNDQYWLLLPFHVVWDGANVTDDGMHETPLGKKSAERIVVKYASGGYSPGDTWELYVGRDNRVEEFIYRAGGPKKHVVISTWTAYKKAGPLDISTDHRGTANGKPMRIFISDLAVKVTGSDAWLEAK